MSTAASALHLIPEDNKSTHGGETAILVLDVPTSLRVVSTTVQPAAAGAVQVPVGVFSVAFAQD